MFRRCVVVFLVPLLQPVLVTVPFLDSFLLPFADVLVHYVS